MECIVCSVSDFMLDTGISYLGTLNKQKKKKTVKLGARSRYVTQFDSEICVAWTVDFVLASLKQGAIDPFIIYLGLFF